MRILRSFLRPVGMFLLFYGSFPFGLVQAQNESEPARETFAGDFSCVSVGEYWLEQVTHRGSPREKLDAEYRQGDFRVGIRYEIDQETRIDTLVLIGITKRFLEYKKDLLTLTAGNFYTTFGRGLTLRGFEEPDIYYDRDFDGLRLAAAWPKAEVTALVARPQNSATRKREGQLTGVEVTGSPLPFLSLGSSYVRSDAANTPQDPSFGLPVEELVGGSAGLNLNGVSLYGEFASRNTWGEYDPSFGWVGAKNAQGQGFYLSTTAGLAGLALSGEYKDYRNLDSPVNAPPTCNRTGRPLNYGRDERGYHVAVNGSPNVNLNLLGDYADSYTKDKSQRYSEATAEAQWQNLGVWLLEGSVLRTREAGLQASIPVKTEIGPAVEYTRYLGEKHSVTLSGQHHQAKLAYRVGAPLEYFRDNVVLTYSYAPRVVVFVSWEQANKKIPEYANEDRWILGDLTLKLTEDHELRIQQGQQRGGLVCAGGVCRYEIPFQGTKIIFTSRF